jgi:hypothetical protein
MEIGVVVRRIYWNCGILVLKLILVVVKSKLELRIRMLLIRSRYKVYRRMQTTTS